jgi:hypothetical protein
MRRIVFLGQGLLQLLVGASAAVSGVLMMIAPDGRIFKAPPDMLTGSPFRDFFVPGLILFLVHGVGTLTAGVLTLRRHPLAGFAGMVFGLGMMIWIFVQVSMIGGGSWLQYGYFGLGVIELSLAVAVQELLRGRFGK